MPIPLVTSLVLAMLVVGAWAYSTSFAGVLVLDDIRAVAQNLTIRTLWPLSVPLSPPAASTVAGRPIANLSFAINYALAPTDARDVFAPSPPAGPAETTDAFQRNIWGYHALNLLVHLTAGLALFGVVRRTLHTEALRHRFGSAAHWLAFVTALLWLVHPLQTASVTYVVQRVESLMGMFYLLTLYCAIRATASPRPRAWAAAAIVSCALGMGTKEVMVTAPLLVGLWFVVFNPHRAWKPPWLLPGLAVTWIIFVLLVLREHRGPSIAFSGEMAWRYLLTQAEVITHYLRLSVVPSPLVFLYDWPLVPSLTVVGPQAAFLTALIVLTVLAAGKRSPLGFAGAWFFLILAPTSSVLPIITEVAAEHRMYLPLASVIACAVLVTFVIGRRVLAGAWVDETLRRRAGPGLAIVLTAILVGYYATSTHARNRDYHSAVQLWSDTVGKRPESHRARVALGESLAAAGRLEDAEAQLAMAVERMPADAVAHVRLGSVLAARGRLEEAIAHLERALALDPSQPDANRLLGIAYAVRGQDTRAVPHLERALAERPDDLEVLARLAAILANPENTMVADALRAVALAERAVALTQRRDPMMLNVLSVALAADHRAEQAASTAEEGLALARAQGDLALARELEYRARVFRSLGVP